MPDDLPSLVHHGRFYATGDKANQPVFTHVHRTVGEHDRLSFAQLDQRARAIAAVIQSKGGSGKPVLIVLDPGIDYATALYGCFYARAIAVPVYPPQMLRLQHTLSRLQAIVANAGAELMLSSREIIGDEPGPIWGLSHDAAIAVDDVEIGKADAWDEILPAADDVALLQYTSGSTGNPQGVILRHHAIQSNLKALLHQFHFPDVRCVQWVPPYHDMGLVGGILVPVYVGVETVLLSPTDFVRDPLLWLQCIDHYRGTSNGAPNFGYELCVRKIKDEHCEGLDLSSWKVAIAGAEPVRYSTLKRFSEKFEPFGFDPKAFSPAYGMAETTLVVSGSQVGHPFQAINVDAQKLQQGAIQESDSDDSMTLVSSGDVVLGMEIEIVDPETRRLVCQGQIGEIWVRGNSLADGYWKSPDRTAESFGASLATDDQDVNQHSDYLRTGDLGALIDGQLYVTGRRKELIIVAGKNLYPHDVEEVVQATSASFKASSGTAFGIETENGEQLVVVQEMTRPKKFDQDTLLRDCVAALAESLQVTPHAVVLVRSGSLPKTSSGKLRRRDVRQAFLSGELHEVARWQSGESSSVDEKPSEPPQGATETEIAAIWQRILGVDSVGRNDNFFYLGGSSLLVTQMITTVSQQFGVDLALHSIFHHPTLDAFSSVVEQNDKTQARWITGSSSSGDQPHPLSSAQQRIWLLSRLDQSDAFLNVPVSVLLDRQLNRDQLEQGLNRLIKRHAALRTSLTESAEGPLQVILPTATIEVDVLDATDPQQPAKFNNAPLDLGHAPLMRAALTVLASGESRVDLVLHHLVCDASSVAILLEDLQRILAEETLDPVADLRYVDYAVWEHKVEQQTQIDRSLSYWRERLQGVPPLIGLPHDTHSQDPTDGVLSETLSDELSELIQRAALKHGVTASMVFLTAYQTVLARYSASTDLAILIPSSSRPTADLEQVVGCYVNPIVYRASIDATKTLSQALATTRENLLSDLQHADVPFQKVVDAIGHDRAAGRMPLAQTMFLYQPSLRTIDHLGAAKVLSVTPDYSSVTAYDLSLIVHPVGTGFEIWFVHGRHCSRSTAKRMFDSLVAVMRQAATHLTSDAAANPLVVGGLGIPATSEQDFLSNHGQGIALEIDDVGLLGRLRKYAQSTPSTIALEDDDQSLSYAELETLTNTLAGRLVATGVSSGTLIGVCLPRSCEMAVAIISIWKAGGGYVPLSSDLPESRLSDMIDDANLSLVIDHEKYQQLLSDSTTSDVPLTLPKPNDLAYVIYTSGSTGKPKGVAIEHHSVANLLQSFAAEPGFSADDSMLALTTLSFDISVLELFLPLWCGVKTRITAHTVAADPDAVIQTIRSTGVTHVQATPSTIRMLLSSAWKPHAGLVILSGGEPLTPDVAEELLACGCVLWNVYGPTETTVWSAIERIEDASDITIGHPIANTQLMVVDDQFRQTPIGVTGELCIGGHGLSRGYLNRDELTAEKFVTVGGERIYRTGDLARLRGDGRLEFLARNDRQIKLRGFRIELDEIESVLQKHGHVQRVAVVLDEVSGSSPRIVAFCQHGDQVTTEEALQKFAAQHLPSYMVPVVTFVKEIPRSSAGKTDYSALTFDSTDPLTSLEFKVPKTPLESTLAEAWCEVLNCEKVGRDDNFFNIGGNSLLAAQLFARLRDRFNMDLPLREVYERPTIASLSELILQRQSQQQPDEFSKLLDQIDLLSEAEALQVLGESRDLGQQKETSSEDHCHDDQ